MRVRLRTGGLPRGGVVAALSSRRNKNSEPEPTPYKTLDTESLITDILQRKTNVQHFRESEYIHVSDLIYTCARKIAFSKIVDIPNTPEVLPHGKAITFKIGESIHDYIVENVSSVGDVLARWRCVCGETEQIGTKSEVADIVCKTCNNGLDVYREIQLKDDEYKILGSVDLIVKIGDHFHISELKSMAAARFSELERPLPEHILQVMLYWWLATRNEMPVTSKPSILYVTKDFTYKNPFKEFTVDPADHLSRLEPLLEDAKRIVQAVSGSDTLPERVTCPTIKCPAAKQCPFSVRCFNHPQ